MKNLIWKLLPHQIGGNKLLMALSLMAGRPSELYSWLDEARTQIQVDDIIFTQKGTDLYCGRRGHFCNVAASALLGTRSLEQIVATLRQPYRLVFTLPKYKIYEYLGKRLYTLDFELDILNHYALAACGIGGDLVDHAVSDPNLKLDIQWAGEDHVYYTLKLHGRSIVRWLVQDYRVVQTTIGKLGGRNALPLYPRSNIPSDAVFIGESDDWRVFG